MEGPVEEEDETEGPVADDRARTEEDEAEGPEEDEGPVEEVERRTERDQ